MVKRGKSIQKVLSLLFVSLLMFSSCGVPDSYHNQSVYRMNIEDSESDYTVTETGKPIDTEPATEIETTATSETITATSIKSDCRNAGSDRTRRN